MTGTFIDTIVICTLTGLSIVLTGAWQVEGLEGVEVTTYAYQQGLPFPPAVSSFVLMLALYFLHLSTILGWDYYSERCLEYLSGGNLKHVKVYRWIYIFAVFIGPYMTVSAVWTIADIFNGLMASAKYDRTVRIGVGLLSGKQKRFLRNRVRQLFNVSHCKLSCQF